MTSGAERIRLHAFGSNLWPAAVLSGWIFLALGVLAAVLGVLTGHPRSTMSAYVLVGGPLGLLAPAVVAARMRATLDGATLRINNVVHRFDIKLSDVHAVTLVTTRLYGVVVGFDVTRSGADDLIPAIALGAHRLADVAVLLDRPVRHPWEAQPSGRPAG